MSPGPPPGPGDRPGGHGPPPTTTPPRTGQRTRRARPHRHRRSGSGPPPTIRREHRADSARPPAQRESSSPRRTGYGRRSSSVDCGNRPVGPRRKDSDEGMVAMRFSVCDQRGPDGAPVTGIDVSLGTTAPDVTLAELLTALAGRYPGWLVGAEPLGPARLELDGEPVDPGQLVADAA